MVTRLAMDYSSKLAIFSIGSATDVEKLPTMTEYGKEEAADFQPVSPNSYALLNDGSGGRYILSDSDVWTKEG